MTHFFYLYFSGQPHSLHLWACMSFCAKQLGHSIVVLTIAVGAFEELMGVFDVATGVFDATTVVFFSILTFLFIFLNMLVSCVWFVEVVELIFLLISQT